MMATHWCELCGQTFTSNWSDDDALDELESTFGEVTDDDHMIVCDPCYQVAVAGLNAQPTRH
jgi:hypothetical protein